jgi:response regulator of citrate/malate metabolism
MVMEIHKRFIHSTDGFIIGGTASDGLEAIDLLEECSTSVDLVILDIYILDSRPHITSEPGKPCNNRL